MAVPLLDLNRAYSSQQEELEQAVLEVCRSQGFILGPVVERFEKNVADYLGCAHAVGCASGTDALILSLQALGIGEGDEVITTPFSFFASASSIRRVDARPVFVDVEPDTLNIDPDAVESAVTSRTRAILPVHLFGQCAATERLQEIADRHDLAIVEDACQAMGATRDGRPAGTLGDVAAFSFYPTKNLGGFGDGGMVTTDSDELAQRVRSLRAHGIQEDSYMHYSLGINSRLDAVQAAALDTKLPALEEWLEERRQIAASYDALLDHPRITLPTTAPANQHTYHQYTVRISEIRDEVCDALDAGDIGHKIFYPLPLHRQPCFKTMGYQEGDLPRSELAAQEVVSLPIFPGLTEEEIQEVARVLLQAVENTE